MNYVTFDQSKPLDMIPMGRATVDLNPLEYYCPLKESETFRKYVGGSPANIAVGLARLGNRVGFLGCLSKDKFGDYIYDYFEREGIDTSGISRAGNGEVTGLTFTEMLSEHESNIMMYRDHVADLALRPEDVKEEYVASAKALLISGTALAASPSREACLKALGYAKKNGTAVIFDIDYRSYTWESKDELSLYCYMVAEKSDLIFGSREEFDLIERLHCPHNSDRESAEYWCGKNARILVIKHGKEGSTAFGSDGKSFGIKPFPVKAFKSFGGGDGYASACLHGILHGWELQDCIEFGSASAAMLVASHGCSPDMPTEEKIREFIKKTKEAYGEMVARV